jgi:hypothetical protein
MLPIQCKACDHRFESEIGGITRCPECGSDQLEGVPFKPVTSVPTRAELDAMPRSELDELVEARIAQTELPPPPRPVIPSEVLRSIGRVDRPTTRAPTYPNVNELGEKRTQVACFIGAFVEALIDGAHGVEVRVRHRSGELTLQGNRFLPGGRRIEDSQRVSEHEIHALEDPLAIGHQRGAAVARVLAAGTPE